MDGGRGAHPGGGASCCTRWAAPPSCPAGRRLRSRTTGTQRCGARAQRGGRISELQAYQHSLNLTNGGGASATAAQSGGGGSDAVALPHRGGGRRPPPRRRRLRLSPRARERRGAPSSLTRSGGRGGGAAAAAVVGRGGGGQTPEGDTQAIARARQHRHGRRRGVPYGSAGRLPSPPPTRTRSSATGLPNRTATRQRLRRCRRDGGRRCPRRRLGSDFLRGGSGGAHRLRDVRSSAAMNPVAPAGPEGADGDVIEATSHPPDLDRVMASVASRVPSWPASLVRGFFVAERSPRSASPWRSTAPSWRRRCVAHQHDPQEVERDPRRPRRSSRYHENGALSLIAAGPRRGGATRWTPRSTRWRSKTKLTASIAPRARERAQGGGGARGGGGGGWDHDGEHLGTDYGDPAAEASQWVTRGDRDKVLANAAQREEEQATAAAKRNEKGADAAATKEEAPEASVNPRARRRRTREKRRRRECAPGSFNAASREPEDEERRSRAGTARLLSRYASKSDDDATA